MRAGLLERSGVIAQPVAAAGYAAAVLAEPSLLSYWRLGEAAGVTMEDSKGAVDGTRSGGLLGEPGLVDDADTAWKATADADYIDFGAVYGFPTGDEFTVEMVLKPTAIIGNRPLIGRHNGANQGWMLIVDSGTGVIDFFTDTAYAPQFPAGTIQAGVRVHLAAVLGPGLQKRAYKNGSLVAGPLLSAGTTVPAGSVLHLGAIPAYGVGLPSVYDELAIYGAPLDAATLLDHAEKAGLA